MYHVWLFIILHTGVPEETVLPFTYSLLSDLIFSSCSGVSCSILSGTSTNSSPSIYGENIPECSEIMSYFFPDIPFSILARSVLSSFICSSVERELPLRMALIVSFMLRTSATLSSCACCGSSLIFSAIRFSLASESVL